MKIYRLVAPAVTVVLSLAACSNGPLRSSSDIGAGGQVESQQEAINPSGSAESIKDFWAWFSLHHADLSAMADPNAPIFPEIGQHIKAINRALVFEIGPAPAGEKEFAVSADGKEALFPLVEKIVAAAPAVPGWKIVAFRQKTPPSLLREMAISAQPAEDGKVVPGSDSMGVAVKDMRFSIQKVGGKANVTIFIKDFREDGPQSHMAEMMLHQAVGEYDFVKKLDAIEFKSDSSPEAKDARPFEELGEALDKLIPGAK